MPKPRRERRRRSDREIDDLDIGWRRLVIIERLAVDLGALALVPVSIVLVVTGSLRVESALATGLSAGICLGRTSAGR